MLRPPSNAIECVIFDLFGVIVAFDDCLVYDRIGQRCANPDFAAGKMRDLVSDRNLVSGRTSLVKLHERLVAEFELRASLSEFESLWVQSYSEPMPGIREILRDLSSECRLVLLSNVDKYYWPTALGSIPELENFHARLLSFETGIPKPDKEAFKYAVSASGVEIKRCYFVDDKPENIRIAAQIGLAGHVFQSSLLLKNTLRHAGLKLGRNSEA